MKTATDVGSLRQRLEVQSPPTALDTYNEATGDWVTVGTYWGSVKPLTGREQFDAAQSRATISHRIVMRVAYPITPLNRLVLVSTRRGGLIQFLARSGADLLSQSGELLGREGAAPDRVISRVFNIVLITRRDERNAYYDILATELAGETA